MSFQFKKLPIEGAWLISPHLFRDSRGLYKKVFCKDDFAKAEIPTEYSETSDIVSTKGAVRGLHYQKKNSQAKLIHLIRGSLYDAFVDLRKDSPTYLQHFEILLKNNDPSVIFIPSGCAHGFMALENNTIFSYQCTGTYDPDSCGGILWNDPTLSINWPLKDNLVITEKDRHWPTLFEYLKGEQ